MSTAEQHTVTLAFEGGSPHATFTCHAPDESLCHAVWSCDCEVWWDEQIRNGMPAHRPEPEDDGTWHAGMVDPDTCRLREAFEFVGLDAMHGELTIPVRAEFDCDDYTFRPAAPEAPRD